jgi:hypothetical protein
VYWPGLTELKERMVIEKKSFRVIDNYAVRGDTEVILIDVGKPMFTEIPVYTTLPWLPDVVH